MQLSRSNLFNSLRSTRPFVRKPIISTVKPKAIILTDIIVGVIAMSIIFDVSQTLQKRNKKPEIPPPQMDEDEEES